MNDPDYEVENFWLNFKDSMNNFYKASKIPNRPIIQWSYELNILKSLKQYMEIEYNIKNYISLYAIDVMRINSEYHYGILMTNINRWNAISEHFNYNSNKTKYHNIIFLLLDLYKISEKSEYLNLFTMLELYIMYEDFTPFIRFAISNNKPSILDKISKYCDIYKKINTLYNVKIDNLSGKKIICFINNII